MKRNSRLLLLLLAALLLLFSLVSCGQPFYEFDPGFYELNMDNYEKYLIVIAEKGKEDFSEAQDRRSISYGINSRGQVRCMDCRITIKFIVNEQTLTKTLFFDGEGVLTSGSELITFAKSYTVDFSYEVVDISGTVYDLGLHPTKIAYIVYNNIRYEEWGSPNARWIPQYKEFNNTETLYFTDKIYTKAGIAIDFDACNIFTTGFTHWHSDTPMDKVKTLIFDGSIKYSDLAGMGWENIYKTMPNLQTIYIKDLVYDLNEDAYFRIGQIALPTSGVDFYIGGDVECMTTILSEIDFVNSINSAETFDLSKYERDNKQ